MLSIVVEVDICIAKVECISSSAIRMPLVRDAQKTLAGTWNASSTVVIQIIVTQAVGNFYSLRGKNEKSHTDDCYVSLLPYHDLNCCPPSFTQCLSKVILKVWSEAIFFHRGHSTIYIFHTHTHTANHTYFEW